MARPKLITDSQFHVVTHTVTITIDDTDLSSGKGMYRPAKPQYRAPITRGDKILAVARCWRAELQRWIAQSPDRVNPVYVVKHDDGIGRNIGQCGYVAPRMEGIDKPSAAPTAAMIARAESLLAAYGVHDWVSPEIANEVRAATDLLEREHLRRSAETRAQEASAWQSAESARIAELSRISAATRAEALHAEAEARRSAITAARHKPVSWLTQGWLMRRPYVPLHRLVPIYGVKGMYQF